MNVSWKLYRAVVGKLPDQVSGPTDTSTSVGLFRSIWTDYAHKPWLTVIASEVLHEEKARRDMIAYEAKGSVV